MQISVVIPTRNRKERLLSLLCNLNRSVQPIQEVIIVDASDELMQPQEYAFADNLRIVYQASMPSVCVQRNAGIGTAVSPWVFLCDDDIEVPDDYLQKLSAYILTHPECGAVSGLVLQEESGTWAASYPVTSGRELVLKWIFCLGIWGQIECRQNQWLIRKVSSRYARKGNHISKAGWPVITDFSGTSFTVPAYGLGASLVRRDWLLASPYDEVLDPHGIGDNYGVAAGFPEGGIQIFKDAFVYHHHEQANRLQKPLLYYRRALALDYFMRTKPRLAGAQRRWLLWSLLGNVLIYFAQGDKLMFRSAVSTLHRVLWGNNPYYIAAQQGEKGVTPAL